MSDWKKKNEDWRDEDKLEEEEESECPWVDSKGKVRESAYCQYLLEKHPMMCLKQKLFDQNGEVDEDALLYEVHSDLRDFVTNNLAKKEKQVLDALRIETYTADWKPQLDRIHLQNGTYFLDERGFVPEKELCLNRLPVEYQPDAPAPTKWLEFLDGLLIPEDILTLQEYLGYLLIPSTKAQKMLVMTGKGGEGKSRIGLLLKKLFGEASHSESILRHRNEPLCPVPSRSGCFVVIDRGNYAPVCTGKAVSFRYGDGSVKLPSAFFSSKQLQIFTCQSPTEDKISCEAQVSSGMSETIENSGRCRCEAAQSGADSGGSSPAQARSSSRCGRSVVASSQFQCGGASARSLAGCWSQCPECRQAVRLVGLAVLSGRLLFRGIEVF